MPADVRGGTVEEVLAHGDHPAGIAGSSSLAIFTTFLWNLQECPHSRIPFLFARARPRRPWCARDAGIEIKSEAEPSVPVARARGATTPRGAPRSTRRTGQAERDGSGAAMSDHARPSFPDFTRTLRHRSSLRPLLVLVEAGAVSCGEARIAATDKVCQRTTWSFLESLLDKSFLSQRRFRRTKPKHLLPFGSAQRLESPGASGRIPMRRRPRPRRTRRRDRFRKPPRRPLL